MSLDDFRQFVIDVHLIGSVGCTKAVWETMRGAGYGRILMTTSSTGLYGNFGQANYGAAKLALVGLMKTLSLEGAKYGIRVNTIAPVAATRMTEDLMPPEMLAKSGARDGRAGRAVPRQRRRAGERDRQRRCRRVRGAPMSR